MDTNMILDTGNTAWMIVATLLVLLMTIPGIALFYGGLVRQKNVLSIIMQCMLIVCAVTVIWIAFGYSFVFGTSLMDSGSTWSFLIGGFDKVLLRGITTSSLSAGNIPELIFVLFQCMFAIITPALILGAFAERLKFSGFLIFTVLWSILVYIPMAHWVWGGGWLLWQEREVIIKSVILSLHTTSHLYFWVQLSCGWDGSDSMPEAACRPTE